VLLSRFFVFDLLFSWLFRLWLTLLLMVNISSFGCGVVSCGFVHWVLCDLLCGIILCVVSVVAVSSAFVASVVHTGCLALASCVFLFAVGSVVHVFLLICRPFLASVSLAFRVLLAHFFLFCFCFCVLFLLLA
jgi:hypothetical protein